MTFGILKDNNEKIGMNRTANTFYCFGGKIGLVVLNCSFVHYKKLMKTQFLENGKTWNQTCKLTVKIVTDWFRQVLLHYLVAQGCQDGVEMHTHETHCSLPGVLAVVLACRSSIIWAGGLYQEPHILQVLHVLNDYRAYYLSKML